MKYLFYGLIPLAILTALALIACILSYFILQLTGDILPLHKFISKGTQLLLVLVCLFPLRAYLKLSWTDLGFARKAIFFKQLGLGLGLGLLTLLPILVILYGLEVHIIDETKQWATGYFLERLLISLLLALLISFIEEPLFRGILITGLRKKIGVALAVFLSASYYAGLHFLKNKTAVPYNEIEFSTSFELLAQAFANLINPEILSAFIALFMVGLFLAMIRVQIKNSLGLCIGYHTGWVWLIKMSKDGLNTNYDSEYLYLVSDYDGVVGSLVSVWMVLLMGLYLFYRYTCPPYTVTKNA
ncbi:MAG: CPBP family intramembrane metalloprotease [Methylococcales bacterium]|nr:CPBP family intramembrane metalloprotease [Methylococcales bacterium]MCK5925285.1 CPBP family intramembrane metalloprotease [Methylococcales bacterium]